MAAYIDANRAIVLASSAAAVAAACGTSDATVIRTAQRLGFGGMGVLKQALLEAVEAPGGIADNMRRTLRDVGDDSLQAVAMVFAAHEEALATLATPVARGRLVAAIGALHPARRIAVFGVGPSASLAHYVAAILVRAGRDCLMLDMTGRMLADQLLRLASGDALLVIAYPPIYPELQATLAEARRLSVPVVLMTDAADWSPARTAAVVVPVRRGRAGRVALHGATLVCLEALALGLAEADRGRAVRTLEQLHRLRGAIDRG